MASKILVFPLQDAQLCYMRNLCVHLRRCAKLIWEAHYSWVVGHFAMEKVMVVLQKQFFVQNSNRMLEDISDPTLYVSLSSQPLRRKVYTLLCLFISNLENPSPWIKCLAFLILSMIMTMCLWSLIYFLRWLYWLLAISISQQNTLPNSSSNNFGCIFGSCGPLY